MGCDGSRRRCVRQLARRRRRGSQQAVVGATNSNPTERGQVQYRDVGEKREVPIAVGDVHGELDVVRDGVGDAYEIPADVLLRLAVGDIDHLERALVTQRLLQQRPALLLRSCGAESQQEVRSLLGR